MSLAIINPMTMLFEDFGDIDKKQLYQDIKTLVNDGKISESIREIFEAWRISCGLTDTQLLLCMSTVFPQKVLISLIEDYQFSYLI